MKRDLPSELRRSFKYRRCRRHDHLLASFTSRYRYNWTREAHSYYLVNVSTHSTFDFLVDGVQVQRVEAVRGGLVQVLARFVQPQAHREAPRGLGVEEERAAIRVDQKAAIWRGVEWKAGRKGHGAELNRRGAASDILLRRGGRTFTAC